MNKRTQQTRPVVTAFLRHQGRILIVRRSTRVGSYQGLWSAISGYLEDATPFAQVLREIREETGLDATQVRLICAAPALEIPAPDRGVCWVVHPFLFEISQPEAVRLDWENTELAWVTPEQLADYATVPALSVALQACFAQEQSTSPPGQR